MYSVLKHIELKRLDDCFLPLNSRSEKGIYFYRINICNNEILKFIKEYFDAARRFGVIIEGRIPNPDIKNLGYYNEMMGDVFSIDVDFISLSLKKWLPRMNSYQISEVASAMYETLADLRNKGKNHNILKNIYIKFMCWLYYRFERVVNLLGSNNVPKVLYEGEISQHELLFMRILSGAGCDIILLQYKGDGEYLKLDPKSEYSFEFKVQNGFAFKPDFNIEKVRNELYGRPPSPPVTRTVSQPPNPNIANCTNAWISESGRGLSDFKTPIMSRGNDPKFFYNCFCRINGVESKTTYLNDLYQFQAGLKNSQRKLVIAENKIPIPTVEEIGKIKKGNYDKIDIMLSDLSSNIKYPLNPELQKLAVKVFMDMMTEMSKESDMSLNRLTNRAVYILCWLKRYGDKLFEGWKMPEIACFIYLGGCKNENEALFLKFLSRLPTDVMILVPDRNQKCCLDDKLLIEVTYDDSMAVNKYPVDTAGMHVGTVAYHAERELDTVMYQDSGIYRNRQYGMADSIVLRTMYEEIEILWDQELKYRPNFSTENNVVTIPTIFAKVCGVKNNDVNAYWSSIKKLLTPNALLISGFPCINPNSVNPMKTVAREFLRNGKLRRDVIKQHRMYQYSVLRDEVQEHILNKLQLMLDKRFINGTFENGMEYTIIGTVLNMDRTMIRLIQNFDFTKKNPKIVCLSLNEMPMLAEDTILFTFLNLIGFDVIFFVPTGYQTIEKYMNRELGMVEEHQIGEYVYDLTVPNFNKISDKSGSHLSWRDRLFRRGN